MPTERNEDSIVDEGELFRLLAENVLDYAIFATDREGNITSWPRGAERLLGYREEEMLGRSASVLFTPEDVASGALEREMEQARTTGRGEDDRWHVRKDGDRFWASGVMTPLRDEGGALRGFAKLMRDRTSWKRLEQARQESESRKAAVLETSLDAILTIDHEDRIVEFNPAAEKIFGHRREDVLGRRMGELIVPPEFRPRHYAGMARYLATGEGPVLGKRLELPALRADGTEFPVELSIARVPGEGPPFFTGFARDITDRKLQERHRAAQHAVSKALAEAASIEEAAPLILEAICENLEWDVGGFWLVDEQAGVLRNLDVRRRDDSDLEPFVSASRSRVFARGEGLPGRVWSVGAPVWLSDVGNETNLPRLALIAQAGLRGAFAVPLLLDTQVVGVVEFFSRSIREPDADLLGTMATIGSHVGQFIERKRSEERLRKSEERFRGIVSHSVAGVAEVDLLGRFLFANERYCEIVDRSLEELLALSMQEISHPDELPDNLDLFRRIVRDGVPYVIEKRYVLPDGSEVWVNNSVSGLRDSAGNVTSLVAVCIDVTERRLAEAARREGDARLRTLIDNVPRGAVYRATRQGEGPTRFSFLSAGVERIFGVTAEEGVADAGQIYGAIHEDDRARVADEETLAAGSRAQFDSEFRIRNRSGELRWIHCRSAPHALPSGEIAWEGVMLDVTDRKRVEATLQEHQDRLRLALEAGRMGTWNWDLRTNEVRWSEQLEAIHGLAPGTFPGTFEAFQSDMHLEDRDRVLATIQEAVASGADYRIEYRLILPDGELRWVEARGKLFRDEAGQPRQMIGVCLEITERKRKEEDLRFLAEASRSLASLVDLESTLHRIARLAVPHFADWCSIHLADETGTLLPVAVAHVDPKKVDLAEEMRKRWPPDPDAPGGAHQAFRTGESILVEDIPESMLRAAVKDDEYYEVLVALGLRSYLCVPLTVRETTIGVMTFVAAESGRRYRAADLALAEDLGRRAAVASENARLYARVREEGRKKDEFLAMLAHELRNPLAPIRSGLDLLELEGTDSEILGMMQQQVEHLVRLVDDLLDVSRIMRGKIDLRKESVETASVVARAVDTVRPMIESQKQTLTVDLPPDAGRLYADPVRLTQAIGNLLNNASKYTEAGGRIALSVESRVESRDDRVTIRVRDTGMGIAPDLLPHVFDLFTQDSRTIDRSQGGLGIGLTVVKSLVEMHGGHVTVASAGVGQGSEFAVSLPLMNGPESTPVVGEPSDNTSRLRILVVDDNHSAANVLGRLLSKLGEHEVTVAHEGASALTLAEESRPDLVLLDIGLPNLDGFEVARRLRKIPGFDQVRLVALTGYGSEDDRRRSREAGFDEHLVKPPGIETLKEVLTRASEFR